MLLTYQINLNMKNYFNHKKTTQVTKEDFNLNSRFYSKNAAKTHNNKQRRYWALGLGPTPRATPS